MWIPQLLASLRRVEFHASALQILQKIATTFPQALHYPLRAFIAETELLLYQCQTHKNRADAGKDTGLFSFLFFSFLFFSFLALFPLTLSTAT
jgi:hypothetical protein